jgi:hypothetical protein
VRRSVGLARPVRPRFAAIALACAWLAGTATVARVDPAAATPSARETARLSVWNGGAWREWWRADRAPVRWTAADSTLTRSLSWQPLAKGLQWASLRLACGAPTWRARLIVARIDPREVRLSLDFELTRADRRPAWTIDHAPSDAVLAVNAGQFVSTMPWGWVLIDGRERLRPGRGPLSSTIAIDGAGRVQWTHGDSLVARADIVTGFQSYPTLLAGDGAVPLALRIEGRGVDLAHRDARLALGETRDGRLLIVMTRFDAMGEIAGAVPLGPTTPEMAAIMGGLGARDAVLLDGGISAQLLLHDAARKKTLAWRGLRKVPLALIARPR